MSMSLSKEDKEELKNHTSALIDALDSKNRQRTASLLKVLRKSKEEIRQIDKRQLFLEEENKALKHEVRLLGSELRDIVGREKAANLIIFGLEEKVDEDELAEGKPTLVHSIIEEFQQVKIDISIDEIKTAGRIGTTAPNKTRPVMVKLSQPSIKKKIFEKGKALYMNKKISVNNDLTRTQRKEKKELLSVKKLFDGENIPVKIKGFSLLWNDTYLNWENALETFNELKNIGFKKVNKDQLILDKAMADSEAEEVLSDDSSWSMDSNNQRKRKTFSQKVLDSTEVRKRANTGGTGQQKDSSRPSTGKPK